MPKSKKLILILFAGLAFGYGAKSALAQTGSVSVLYVPLIGITTVPQPLALPKGPGSVTYNYAVKNFLRELPLTNIRVADDNCSPVKYLSGDDNADGKLDFNETWRYSCTATVATTTQSTATATGNVNGITATHQANATVVVGSSIPPPLVSIVNITKVAYPLSLPSGGGQIDFTYKVTNPGVAALSDVTVTDDKCSNISGKLGDTNGNNLLDTNEVWTFACAATLTQTTTNTAEVTAFANGLKAVGRATITVTVDTASSSPPANLFDVTANPGAGTKTGSNGTVWEILAGILAVLLAAYFILRKRRPTKL